MEKSLETARGKVYFRPYLATDENEVVSLWKTVFQNDLPLNLWRWKYHLSPYQNRAVVCVDDKNRIIVLLVSH